MFSVSHVVFSTLVPAGVLWCLLTSLGPSSVCERDVQQEPQHVSQPSEEGRLSHVTDQHDCGVLTALTHSCSHLHLHARTLLVNGFLLYNSRLEPPCRTSQPRFCRPRLLNEWAHVSWGPTNAGSRAGFGAFSGCSLCAFRPFCACTYCRCPVARGCSCPVRPETATSRACFFPFP